MSSAYEYDILKEEQVSVGGQYIGTRLTNEYKLYKTLKTAISLGLHPQQNGDKIMLSNGRTTVYLSKRLTDYEYCVQMRELRQQLGHYINGYTDLMGLKPENRMLTREEIAKKYKLQSKPYRQIAPNPEATNAENARNAFPETDPEAIDCVKVLLEDMTRGNLNSQERTSFEEIIVANNENVLKMLNQTSWGKSIASAMRKYSSDHFSDLTQQQEKE